MWRVVTWCFCSVAAPAIAFAFCDDRAKAFVEREACLGMQLDVL